jgi:hypothetical protein
MPLTAPLSLESCTKISLCKELGPAQITLIPYCKPDYKEIFIGCDDQRDDLTVMFGKEYIEVPNQCSVTPKSIESAKKLEAKVSLGCAVGNPKILAALMDTDLVVDQDDEDWINMEITDSPGKQPAYWEVLIQPLENSKPSFDWRIKILYAFIVIDQGDIVFSPKTPRSLTFTVRGLMHPEVKSRGRFQYSKKLLGM